MLGHDLVYAYIIFQGNVLVQLAVIEHVAKEPIVGKEKRKLIVPRNIFGVLHAIEETRLSLYIA